jgi:2-hydroxychromene-2-carboxylate isomerase
MIKPRAQILGRMTQPTTTVDFWFDPICPWAWITSRWMLEVEQVRPVRARWHVMSLAVLHEGDELPDNYAQVREEAMSLVRVIMAAQREHGDDVVLPLYTALGTRIHEQKAARDRDTVERGLAEAGLPANLADAMTSTAYDDEVRRSHRAAMDHVGDEVGTPVISVDGSAIFGPVVSPIPRGDIAGRLWDGVIACLGVDGFFELKRSRTRDPIFD